MKLTFSFTSSWRDRIHFYLRGSILRLSIMSIFVLIESYNIQKMRKIKSGWFKISRAEPGSKVCKVEDIWRLIGRTGILVIWAVSILIKIAKMSLYGKSTLCRSFVLFVLKVKPMVKMGHHLIWHSWFRQSTNMKQTSWGFSFSLNRFSLCWSKSQT